jgi:hypothetical protein
MFGIILFFLLVFVLLICIAQAGHQNIAKINAREMVAAFKAESKKKDETISYIDWLKNERKER